MEFQQNKRETDIVYVIDTTAAMAPIIDDVKDTIIRFGDIVRSGFKDYRNRDVRLRTRLITFTDYAYDGWDALMQTDFFDHDLPDERAAFEKAVRDIKCSKYSGERVGNGLEALYVAMMSDWAPTGPERDRRRVECDQVTVLISNSYPLHLQERKNAHGYCSDEFPPNTDELQYFWDSHDWQNPVTKLLRYKKNLILCVPQGRDDHGHSWFPVNSWFGAANMECTQPFEFQMDMAVIEVLRRDEM